MMEQQIDELIESLDDRFVSIQPLPTKKKYYIDWFFNYLNFVHKNKPSKIELENWLSTFSSSHTVRRCMIELLQKANIILINKNLHIEITKENEPIILNKDYLLLCSRFFETYYGFLEIVSILSSGISITRQELRNTLSKQFNISPRQYQNVLKYLECFKVITVQNGKIHLNNKAINRILSLLRESPLVE